MNNESNLFCFAEIIDLVKSINIIFFRLLLLLLSLVLPLLCLLESLLPSQSLLVMLSQIFLSHQYMPITTELLMTTLEPTLPKLSRETDMLPLEATPSTFPTAVSRLWPTLTTEMVLSRMFLTLEPHHMDQPSESQLLLRLLPAQPLLRLLPQLLLPAQLLLLPHLSPVLLQLLLPMAQSLSVKPDYKLIFIFLFIYKYGINCQKS